MTLPSSQSRVRALRVRPVRLSSWPVFGSRIQWGSFFPDVILSLLLIVVFVDIHHLSSCQLVRICYVMEWITTSEFAELAGISHQTAWRVIRASPTENKVKTGKFLLIEKSHAINWIDERKANYCITPDKIGKLIRRSGSYVRKILEMNPPSFVKRQKNRRWLILRGPEFDAWIEIQKNKLKPRLKKELISGVGSGILNIHGVLLRFERWTRKVGGCEGILTWPEEIQRDFLEGTIEIAQLRLNIIKHLGCNKNFSESEITDSENDYSLALQSWKEGESSSAIVAMRKTRPNSSLIHAAEKEGMGGITRQTMINARKLAIGTSPKIK